MITQVPALLFEEFEKALSELKSGKSQGIDGLPVTLLKPLGSRGKQERSCMRYATTISGEWPRDFLESVIIPIEKKNGAQECVDF